MRRWAPAWLSLVVMTAHLTLLHWAAARLHPPAGWAAASAPAHRWLLARALTLPARPGDRMPAPAPAVPPVIRPDSAAAPQRPRSLPALPPPRPATDDRPAEGAGAPVATDLPSAAATRFYGYDEVDIAAEPQSDWAIDVHALDALALSRIVVTLWVDDEGTVQRCTVDEPERLSLAEREALAERIARTPLTPARRNGVAVASKRRIELTTTGG